MVTLEKYVVGSGETEGYRALKGTIPPEDKYMHYRLDGNALDVCNDLYFVAHEDGVALSRVWMCYPGHEHAIANWGAFFTLEACRGQGIGRKVLDFCFEEIAKMQKPPLALFCTGGKPWLAELYGRYGFVPAIHGTSFGPLYCPRGNSPKTFQEFCESYYTPARELRAVKATYEWRNEIDCLLNFAMQDMGLNYAINGESELHNILLHTPEREAQVLLTDENKCVGWMLEGKATVHPRYAHLI